MQISEKDKLYILETLKDQIKCKNGNNEIVFVKYEDFITNCIRIVDQKFLELLYNEFLNQTNKLSHSQILLNKFKELQKVEPILYINEEFKILNFELGIFFSFKTFMMSYEILKESYVSNIKSNTIKNNFLESTKIYYSKYKSTSIFYSKGEHIIEIFDNDTISIKTPSNKLITFDILSAQKDKNDLYYSLKNQRSGSIGYFKIMPLGKAELKFDIGNCIKLKI